MRAGSPLSSARAPRSDRHMRPLQVTDHEGFQRSAHNLPAKPDTRNSMHRGCRQAAHGLEEWCKWQRRKIAQGGTRRHALLSKTTKCQQDIVRGLCGRMPFRPTRYPCFACHLTTQLVSEWSDLRRHANLRMANIAKCFDHMPSGVFTGTPEGLLHLCFPPRAARSSPQRYGN